MAQINYDDLFAYEEEVLAKELEKKQKELKSLRATKLRLSHQIPALRNALYEIRKRATANVEDMLK